MGTIRTLVMIGAALCAGLTLNSATGRAEPQTKTQTKPAASAPLLLAPAVRPAKTHRSAKAKKSQHTAHRGAAPPAHAVAHDDADRNVMRDGDSVSLIARLPWWRADELQVVRYREREVESPVLSVTDAWFAAHGTTVDERDYALASARDLNEIDLAADDIQVADANDVNAIDLAASDDLPTQDKSWLHILLATLGGALAAASTARFLFV